MFSATLPANIISLSKKYLTNPQRIAIGSTNAVASKVRQELVKTNEAMKYGELLNQLQNREGSVLIFVKTKYGAERLAGKLNKAEQPTEAIHGDLQPKQKGQGYQQFPPAKVSCPGRY